MLEKYEEVPAIRRSRIIIPLVFVFVIIANTFINAQTNSVLFRFNANHDSTQTISSAVAYMLIKISSRLQRWDRYGFSPYSVCNT